MSREGRHAARYEGASCNGDFVQFDEPDPNNGTKRITFAVPANGNTGASAAELLPTTRPLTAVRYRLQPQHRLFLMAGDLATDGVMAPDPYVQLPANPPDGSVQSFDLTDAPFPDPPVYHSMRVYDGGSCSLFTGWDTLITGLSMRINKFLVEPQFGPFGSAPLTLKESTVTPILMSGTGDLGRSSELDQVNITFEYQAIGGQAFGCDEGKLRLVIGLRVVREPALLPTLDGELDDRVFTRLQPWPDPADPDVYDCLGQCIPEREDYACWRWCDEHSLTPGETTVRLARHVRAVRDAFDYRPELVFLDGGMVDCVWSGLNDTLTGMLAGKIQSFLPGVLADLTGELAVVLPNDELGIAYEDLAPCGRMDPDTGELFASQAMCGDSSPRWYGNRRPVCLGFNADHQRDDQNPVDYRCAMLNTEVRRISLRPDGIEVVLANAGSDPQYAFLTATHPQTCDPVRIGTRQWNDTPAIGAVRDTDSALIAAVPQSRRRICHPDDALSMDASGNYVGCAGLCGDTRGFNSRLFTGSPCWFFVRSTLGYCADDAHPENCRPDVTHDSCYVVPNDDGHDERGQAACCPPENFCQIPREGGGMRYFGNDADPPQPDEYWRCVEFPDRDNWACGGCGNVCGTDQHCTGGICCVAGEVGCGDGLCHSATDLASDPNNCGGCGNACAASQSCVSGTCT